MTAEERAARKRETSRAYWEKNKDVILAKRKAKREAAANDRAPRYKTDSLCWDCANAVPDRRGHGCPWSRAGKPVDGWDAVPMGRMQQTGDLVDTYLVKTCPMFRSDVGEPGKPVGDATGEEASGCRDLFSAIVALACRDYKAAVTSRTKKDRRACAEIEAFLRSGVLGDMDADWLISRLRREAERAENRE